jgi:hypothetical protein
MIGRSMTDPLPVLSPSSVLPPTLSQCVFIPATKNAAHFEIVIISIFFKKNCLNLELRNLKSVSRRGTLFLLHSGFQGKNWARTLFLLHSGFHGKNFT